MSATAPNQILDEASATTTQFFALQTSCVSSLAGDATGAVDFPVAKMIQSWPFLTGVDVAASAQAFAVVAFGDSLIDGDGSTADANHRWPDARLHRGAGRGVGVLNEGIIGNRLLKASPGTRRMHPT